MVKYTVYCTTEQTKKAYNLGAPIRRALYPSTWFEEIHPKRCHIDVPENPNGCTLAIPTAEEMIGWLEEQECISEVDIFKDFNWSFSIWDDALLKIDNSHVYISRQEATLAAIDAALEYLSKNKK